jgi:hypothetical protein
LKGCYLMENTKNKKVAFRARSLRMPVAAIEAIQSIKDKDKIGITFNSIAVECIIRGLKEIYKIEI